MAPFQAMAIAALPRPCYSDRDTLLPHALAELNLGTPSSILFLGGRRYRSFL